MANGILLMVVKRNGELVNFNAEKIKAAIQKAVGASKQELKDDLLDTIVEEVAAEVKQRFIDFFPNVENVQDIVEKYLVKNGLYEISKHYILYRAQRQKKREEEREANVQKARFGKLTVMKRSGKKVLFDMGKIRQCVTRLSADLKEVNPDIICKEVLKNVYDGITTTEIEKALSLAAVSFIERDPEYDYTAGRLFLQRLYKEVIRESTSDTALSEKYRGTFIAHIKKGVEEGYLDRRLLDFDLEKLAAGLDLERDLLFKYIGIQTLYERYFLRARDTLLELPQSFWMRVAMGLAVNEQDKNKRALEFYEVFSSLRFVSSTPTLFHSGLTRSQLSSCYLTTVEDDLSHIFKCIGDNAQLSKWTGGLGNDWSNIRATGSLIQSTNVESQGVIPFLKIANDTTAAINRSGKRRGATCAYLETWHLDIEDFLDLRRNTGDDRRRTHDMNTANWVPDLFMKRVLDGENWTLFSPDEVPDLHHSYGRKFEKKYTEYEDKARNGKIRKHKVIPAKQLWRKMLTRLFETGHPWITFKDPCNIRSPQDHVGIVHSSNLCTEITLNTSKEETAVCNLGSINLEKHVEHGKLNKDLLQDTIEKAVRMLDNVIDINFYPTPESKNANLKHRPVGLGLMGLQDALFKLNITFESPEALTFMDTTMEFVSFHAIFTSSKLAKERGPYESYRGSKWDRGLFPIDTVTLLEEERGVEVEVPKESALDWTEVREHVKLHGMRNSNTMAIAPTATISNIAGCFPCIEPIYKNLYVKANISGEFTVVNTYLVNDLKKRDLWNEAMLEQLKYYDGNVSLIPNIPPELKQKYQEVFDLDPVQMIALTAVRAKWIDQSQSHNIFMKGTSGTQLSDIYLAAWKKGLKTTYYLRTLAASQIEKSTLDGAKYGFTQKREYKEIKEIAPQPAPQAATTICVDPECEACQ